MQSNLFGNTYQPQSIGMANGNFTDPYAGMASWSYDNPAIAALVPVAGLS